MAANLLAAPELRGRDTPSAGLDRAEAYVVEELTSYGFTGLGPDGSFLLPWTYPRPLETPVDAGCSFTAHCTLGKRGNNPFCYHRATTLASQGRRERLVRVEQADGIPYDFGRFDVVEEPLDATDQPGGA